MHWRQPDGAIGWLRVEHHAPTRARAEERRLIVECDLHPTRGPQPVRWVTNTTPFGVDLDRWRLPGLTVDVTTEASLEDPEALRYGHLSGARFELDLTPDT